MIPYNIPKLPRFLGPPTSPLSGSLFSKGGNPKTFQKNEPRIQQTTMTHPWGTVFFNSWFFLKLLNWKWSNLTIIIFCLISFSKWLLFQPPFFFKVESFLFEWTHWTGVFPFESLPFFWAFCCAARHKNRLLGSWTAAAATVVVAAALGPRRMTRPPRGNLRGIRAVPKSLERWGCRRGGFHTPLEHTPKKPLPTGCKPGFLS